MNLQRIISNFLAALCAVGFLSFSIAATPTESVRVLGVISSSSEAVALVKNVRTTKTFAARIGATLAEGIVLEKVEDKFVIIRVKGELKRLPIGEDSGTFDMAAAAPLGAILTESGIEKAGSAVRITASYRDHILKNDLAKVLMQAAAVPYFSNGELAGFRLWNIEPGSIYEKLGFQDGDVITALNGKKLMDVGSTIRLLNSMREEPSVDVTLTRNGQTQQIAIAVN